MVLVKELPKTYDQHVDFLSNLAMSRWVQSRHDFVLNMDIYSRFLETRFRSVNRHPKRFRPATLSYHTFSFKTSIRYECFVVRKIYEKVLSEEIDLQVFLNSEVKDGQIALPHKISSCWNGIKIWVTNFKSVQWCFPWKSGRNAFSFQQADRQTLFFCQVLLKLEKKCGGFIEDSAFG